MSDSPWIVLPLGIYYLAGVVACARLYAANHDPNSVANTTFHWRMVFFLAWIWPLCVTAYWVRTSLGKTWPPEGW